MKKTTIAHLSQNENGDIFAYASHYTQGEKVLAKFKVTKHDSSLYYLDLVESKRVGIDEYWTTESTALCIEGAMQVKLLKEAVKLTEQVSRVHKIVSIR